ncbi:MAG: peptide ABC transporter substrate-binding protein [Planctomycetota bacterium]
MSRALLPVILLLGLVGLAVLTDRPPPRADLVMYNGNDVNTLDPQRMTWMPDLRIARMLYEGLVRNDVLSDGFDIVPGAAERWEVSSDGLTYTFYLREEAKWSNGSPLLASHFVHGWRRALLPDIGSKYIDFVLTIRGGQDFYDWRAGMLAEMESGEGEKPFADGAAFWGETERKFFELVGVEVRDERTLVVTLERPTPHFLDLCAFMTFAPVYSPLLDQYETPDPVSGRLDRRTGWTKPGRLVSNGAFELTGWRFKRDMRLEKNPHYWNADEVALRSVSIPSIGDPNTAVLAYETGAVDFMAEMTAGYRGELVDKKKAFYAEHADEVARMRELGLDQFEIDRRLPDDPRKDIHAVPAFGTYFYNFNCLPELPDGRANPFHDARVRRAFAMVIDKRAIVDEVRRVGEPVARTLIPPRSVGGYAGPDGIDALSDARTPAERETIVNAARALLAEAGYPDPANDFPITVELLFNKDSGHDLIAQVIAKNWSQHLGVSTRLAQKELKVFREDLRKRNYITARAGWYGDFGDPTTFLDLLHTDNGNNDRGYSSAAYDAMLAAAQLEMEPDRRMRMLADAERFLFEQEMPMVPIFHYATVYMFDPDEITGLTTHPRTKQVISLIDVLGDGIGPELPRPMHASRPGMAVLDGAPATGGTQPAHNTDGDNGDGA